MQPANALWQSIGGTIPNGMQQDEAAKGLVIRFELQQIQDEAASEKQGRPVFVEKEIIEIRSPNDPLTIIEREVTPADRRTYPHAYAAFKENRPEQVVGTALREWPPIARSQADRLAFAGVRTVEQLADISDDGCAQLGHGYLTLRNNAIAYLKKAQDGSSTTQLVAEIQQMRIQNESLARQVRDLSAALDKRDEVATPATPKKGKAQ